MKYNYRWIEGTTATVEEWDRVEALLAARGWMSLSRDASRILVAEDDDGKLLGFVVLQLIPHVEPLYVIPSMRATGLAEDLADHIISFLVEQKARGWMAVAESPFAEKLCEREGMQRVQLPVYVSK